MKKLTIRQQANRIRKWYDLATPYQIADGLTWYHAANILANTLATRYGVTTIQAAQVIAVLSPQKKWDANKREALAIFNQHFNGVTPALSYFATARTISECHSIMAGAWALPAKRIKTYSFADNIAYMDSLNCSCSTYRHKNRRLDFTVIGSYFTCSSIAVAICFFQFKFHAKFFCKDRKSRTR